MLSVLTDCKKRCPIPARRLLLFLPIHFYFRRASGIRATCANSKNFSRKKLYSFLSMYRYQLASCTFRSHSEHVRDTHCAIAHRQSENDSSSSLKRKHIATTCPPKRLGGGGHPLSLDRMTAQLIPEDAISVEEVDGLYKRLFQTNEKDGPSNYSQFGKAARRKREFSDLLRHLIDVNRCIGI